MSRSGGRRENGLTAFRIIPVKRSFRSCLSTGGATSCDLENGELQILTACLLAQAVQLLAAQHLRLATPYDVYWQFMYFDHAIQDPSSRPP